MIENLEIKIITRLRNFVCNKQQQQQQRNETIRRVRIKESEIFDLFIFVV